MDSTTAFREKQPKTQLAAGWVDILKSDTLKETRGMPHQSPVEAIGDRDRAGAGGKMERYLGIPQRYHRYPRATSR